MKRSEMLVLDLCDEIDTLRHYAKTLEEENEDLRNKLSMAYMNGDQLFGNFVGMTLMHFMESKGQQEAQ